MLGRLLLILISVPVVEILIFFEVGNQIGAFPTLAIILATGITGAWLVKTQGLRTISKLSSAIHGQQKGKIMANSILLYLAGILLIFPGLMTDFLGVLLLIPSTRNYLRKRFTKSFPVNQPNFPTDPHTNQTHPNSPKIIEAEIVDDEPKKR